MGRARTGAGGSAVNDALVAPISAAVLTLSAAVFALGRAWGDLIPADWRRVARVERRLLGLLRPHVRLVVAGTGVTLASTMVGLAKPWPTKILVDDVLGPGNFLGMGHNASLVVAVGGTMLLFLLSGS